MSVQVVILNGVGSVGKSSIARALQAITAKPFLHVAVDAFIDMLPERMIGHPDGVIFETVDDQGCPSVMIKTGPVMQKTMRGMVHAIAALADQDNNLIVDDVILGSGTAQQYREILSRHQVHFVGLFASLEILEDRERKRGGSADRFGAVAVWTRSQRHNVRS